MGSSRRAGVVRWGVFVLVSSGAAALAGVVGLVLALLGVMAWHVFAWRLGVLMLWALVAAALSRWACRRANDAGDPHRPKFLWVLSVLSMSSVYLCAWAMLRGTPFGDGLPSLVFIAGLAVGSTLIVRGVTRRLGDTLHCPTCEYEHAGPGVAGDEIARCPECGARWLGKLKRGRKARSPRLVAAGIVICVAGMFLGTPVFYLGRVAPVLPTNVLMSALLAWPRSTLAGWEELKTRALTDSEVRRMCEGVLAERQGMVSDSRGTRWMENMVVKGLVPDDLETRFYEEGFRARLEAPARARVGEPFRLSMRVEHMAPDAAINIGVMFFGYVLSDRAEPVGQEPKTRWGYELRPGVLQGSRRAFEESVTANQPGELRVTMVYWLAYQPGFFDQLSWQPDNTPGSPPNVMFLQEFKQERTILIEP